MFAKRTRWILLVVVLLAVAGGVTGGALALQRSTAPTAVAIVNSDTGQTGAKIVKGLQDGGIHDWTVAAPGEVSTADYAAVITLPGDLSGSLTTLASTRPHRAQLTVDTNAHADADLVNDALNEVTRRISAAGMDQTLAAVSTARGSVQQVSFTTQLLGAGVRMATDASGQFTGGADEMLGFLNTAKDGAGQLTAGISQLNNVLGAATTQADGLAGALDATGVTIGQVSGTAAALSTGLNETLPLLRALPFANDPRLADIIGKLDALQGISSQADAQLAGFAQLTGSSTDPSTPVSTLLRDAAGRLTEAGAQLNQGAELAKQVPQLADQGAAQLTGAIQALTGGIQQLQQIVTNLGTQTGNALNALPAHGSSQQSAIATNLSDPVEIVRN
ncbi:membrane protein [Nocardia sp. BMG51109]|uniref:membrane protein n=1 Tax=Nocardia sp. BMG51109 TaxID=1056816 RepID=UPI000465D505|nr:membrane protein [Nocardia sp. BMG51109]